LFQDALSPPLSEDNLEGELWAPGEWAKAAADPTQLGCVSCDQTACFATSCLNDTVGPQLCAFDEHPPFLSLRGLCQYTFLGIQGLAFLLLFLPLGIVWWVQ